MFVKSKIANMAAFRPQAVASGLLRPKYKYHEQTSCIDKQQLQVLSWLRNVTSACTKARRRPQLSKFNPPHVSMPYFHMTHFNIISPSMSICPKRSLHLQHSDRTFLFISPSRAKHVALFILVRPNNGTVKHVRDFRFSQRYYEDFVFCDNTVYNGIQVATFRKNFLHLSSG